MSNLFPKDAVDLKAETVESRTREMPGAWIDTALDADVDASADSTGQNTSRSSNSSSTQGGTGKEYEIASKERRKSDYSAASFYSCHSGDGIRTRNTDGGGTARASIEHGGLNDINGEGGALTIPDEENEEDITADRAPDGLRMSMLSSVTLRPTPLNQYTAPVKEPADPADERSEASMVSSRTFTVHAYQPTRGRQTSVPNARSVFKNGLPVHLPKRHSEPNLFHEYLNDRQIEAEEGPAVVKMKVSKTVKFERDLKIGHLPHSTLDCLFELLDPCTATCLALSNKTFYTHYRTLYPRGSKISLWLPAPLPMQLSPSISASTPTIPKTLGDLLVNWHKPKYRRRAFSGALVPGAVATPNQGIPQFLNKKIYGEKVGKKDLRLAQRWQDYFKSEISASDGDSGRKKYLLPSPFGKGEKKWRKQARRAIMRDALRMRWRRDWREWMEFWGGFDCFQGVGNMDKLKVLQLFETRGERSGGKAADTLRRYMRWTAWWFDDREGKWKEWA